MRFDRLGQLRRKRLVGFARDDVHNAGERVAAEERGGDAFHDFDALNVFNWNAGKVDLAGDASDDRLSVDEDENILGAEALQLGRRPRVHRGR